MLMRSHRVVRPVASIVLVVLATLPLLLGILSNWARTHLYDTDAFADHAVAALEDDAVRASLVQAIVNQIVEVGPPEALSIRPLIEFVTATVVDTQTFATIYRDAIEDLHRGLMQEPNDTSPIALTLVDAMIVITAFLEQAYPEVSNQLPTNLNTALIQLRERDGAAMDIILLNEGIGYLAVAFPLLAVALYATAVWVAPDRRRAVLYIGVSLVAVGIFIVVGRDYAQNLVVAQSPFSDQAVSQAFWNAYTESLEGWAILVGGAGLAITVGATGARRRVNPQQQVAFLRRWITYTPVPVWGKIARAAAFIVAGFVMLRESEQLLEVAVLGVAAYALYYGLSELIWLAGTSREPAPARATEEEVRRRSYQQLALRGGAIAGLAVVSIGALFVTYQAVQTAGGDAIAAPTVDVCNGDEDLCDKRLNEVVFLGTHNSMAAASVPGWFMAEHLTGINTQLNSGVRALLIDTWYGYDTGRGVRTADRSIADSKVPADEYGEEVRAAAERLAQAIGTVQPDHPRGTYLCHSFCELGATPLQQALAGVNSFLDRNPNEVIIMNIQDQITPEDTAKAFIASGLIGRVYHHVPGEDLPTLREMIERDERVFVLADNAPGDSDWYLPTFDFVQETPYRFESREEFSCEPNRGSSGNPIFQMNHWVTTTIPLVSDARIINGYEFLYERVRQCEEARGQMVNMINVNFYEIGQAQLVVDVLNGVVEPPGSEDEDDERDEDEDADEDSEADDTESEATPDTGERTARRR